MGSSSEDWAAVLKRLLDGDRAAFVKMSQLVTGFLVSLRAYDFRDEWDDVIQEVIMAAIEAVHANRLRKRAAIVGYIRTATRYKFVDHLRLKQRRPEELKAPEDLPEICWPPEDVGEGSFGVRDAILKLPEKQRLAVLSVYLEGRTYDEAAQDTAIPLGSLKRYLREGLATLHTQLSEYHESA